MGAGGILTAPSSLSLHKGSTVGPWKLQAPWAHFPREGSMSTVRTCGRGGGRDRGAEEEGNGGDGPPVEEGPGSGEGLPGCRLLHTQVH